MCVRVCVNEKISVQFAVIADIQNASTQQPSVLFLLKDCHLVAMCSTNTFIRRPHHILLLLFFPFTFFFSVKLFIMIPCSVLFMLW